jgi:myo-inositol 2-dehydrogenase / D-chiro-inositol 1-dehydrogenase
MNPKKKQANARAKRGRRDFLKAAGIVTAGGLAIPTIIPASAIGKNPPSDRITIGMIATGRQAIKVNLQNGFLNIPDCQVEAVNDVDSWRMDLAAGIINVHYGKNTVKAY